MEPETIVDKLNIYVQSNERFQPKKNLKQKYNQFIEDVVSSTVKQMNCLLNVEPL